MFGGTTIIITVIGTWEWKHGEASERERWGDGGYGGRCDGDDGGLRKRTGLVRRADIL